MKKLIIFLLIIYIYSCAQKENGIALIQGTPDYELAMKLSEKVQTFNPDENKIIASTNKFDVTVGDIVQRIRTNFGKRADELPSRSDVDLKKLLSEFANSIAILKITLIEAENDGIVVEDSKIDSIMEIQYTRMGGKEKFIEFIKENGSDENLIKRDIKIGEIQRKYIDAKRKELSIVTEEDIDEALNGDRLASVRHILLLTQGKPEVEKREILTKMEEILAKAKSGEDFAELATQYTEDRGSKANGGLYENFPKGKMVPSFEEAAFTVPIGEISEIVETPYGYHILKVLERKKEDRPREKIKEEVKINKQKTVVSDFFEKLKEEYELNIIDIS